MRRAARQFAAEFLGAFFIVLIAAGSFSIDPWLKAAGQPVLGPIGTALAYGLAVAVAIEVFSPISGGHLNPAISLGAWATRRIGTWRLFGYALAQIAGAVSAADLLKALIPDSAWQPAGLGTPVLASSLTRAQGMGLEATLTFAVCLAFFRTASASGKPSGWTVGAAVAASVLLAAPLTGAALNPARAFGPAFAFSHWDNQGVWWIGPLVGGVLAAWIGGLLGKPSQGN
jgi:MIP family channel proteins